MACRSELPGWQHREASRGVSGLAPDARDHLRVGMVGRGTAAETWARQRSARSHRDHGGGPRGPSSLSPRRNGGRAVGVAFRSGCHVERGARGLAPALWSRPGRISDPPRGAGTAVAAAPSWSRRRKLVDRCRTRAAPAHNRAVEVILAQAPGRRHSWRSTAGIARLCCTEDDDRYFPGRPGWSRRTRGSPRLCTNLPGSGTPGPGTHGCSRIAIQPSP